MADLTQADNICAICKSVYTFPRILDCFHILCTPCLELLLKNKSTFACPLCRTVFAAKNIANFEHYAFQDILENHGKTDDEPSCEMCEAIDIYSRCTECDQNMCRNCHDYHLKHNTFRSHTIDEHKAKVEKCNDKPESNCDEHKKKYILYCKACNIPICQKCKRSSHSNHKTQPLKSTANAMKTSIRVSICGLKSKLPYINSFVENAKSEEKKYLTHIQKTQTEMRTAAANIKDVLCKSVDMILAQNIVVLDQTSSFDKKLIQTYIDEAELDTLSTLKLITTAEKMEKFAEDSNIAKLTNGLCRQINLNDRMCFQSKLKISRPKYNPGNFLCKPIQDYVGTVEREEVPMLHLELKLPCFEMSQFPTLWKFDQIYTVSPFRENVLFERNMMNMLNVFAAVDNGVYVSCYAEEGFVGTIRNIRMDGRIWTMKKQYSYTSEDKFKIVGVHSNKLYFRCSSNIKAAEVKDSELVNIVDLTILSPNFIGVFRMLKSGNILIYQTDSKSFHEIHESGRVVRQFSISESTKNAKINPSSILVTDESLILLSSAEEIYTFALSGQYKHSFCNEGANFCDICKDGNGNVFLADNNNDRICLLTPDGHYARDVLTSSDGISKPKSLTIDGCSNLWILMGTVPQKMSVFSYL